MFLIVGTSSPADVDTSNLIVSLAEVGTSNLIDSEFEPDSNSVVADVEDNQLLVVPDRRNYSLGHDLVDPELVVPDRRNYSLDHDLGDPEIVVPDHRNDSLDHFTRSAA